MAPDAVATGTDTGVGYTQAPDQAEMPEASGSPGTTPSPVQAQTPTDPATVAAAASTPGTNLVGQNPDAYNPLAAQPYTAPIPNDVTPLHSPAEALGPDPQANGAAGHAGQIAYGIDKALRGYMKGKAVAQINQGIALHRQATGLQQNLDMASQQYYALSKAGTDPNSPQMQAAKNQVDAAWKANLDFMKQHVAGEQIDKKTGELKPQQGSIASRLFQTQDQAAVPIAAYQTAQTMGPPVYHQTAAFQTPAYQAYAKTQAQTAAATNAGQLGAQEIANQKQGLQKEFNTLAAIPPDQMTDAQRDRRDQLGDLLGTPTEASAARSELLRRTLADPTISDADKIRRVAQLTGKGAGAFTPTLKLATAGSVGEQLDRIARLHVDADHPNGMTRDQLPPEVVDAVNRQFAWDRHIATSNTHTVLVEHTDPATGEKLMVKTPMGGGTSPGPRPQLPPGYGEPDQAAQSAIPSSITHPSAAAGGIQAHGQALSSGRTPTQANATARATATSIQNSWTGGLPPEPDKNVIHTGEPGRVSPMANKVYQAEDAATEALATGKKASTALDDQGLMTAWSRGHLGGRVAQQELSRITDLGDAKTRLEGKIARLVEGKLSDTQRAMFVKGLQDNYDAVHDRAEHYRNSVGSMGQAPKTTTSSAPGAPAAAVNPKDPAGILQ